jgi:hypothetical protein
MESRTDEPIVVSEDAVSAPPRIPPIGTYDARAPLHLTPFAIETNVSRIAIQIAEGRKTTYD